MSGRSNAPDVSGRSDAREELARAYDAILGGAYNAIGEKRLRDGTDGYDRASADVPRRESSPVEERSVSERAASERSVTDDFEAYLTSRRRSLGAESRTDRSTRSRRGVDGRSTERRAPDSTAFAPDSTAFALESSRSSVSKPYLDDLPEEYSAQLELFEWLEGLCAAAGSDATFSALEYYESIGWLSERCREKLETVTAGLAVSDAGERPLDVEDHRESLRYVARLARRTRR